MLEGFHQDRRAGLFPDRFEADRRASASFFLKKRIRLRPKLLHPEEKPFKMRQLTAMPDKASGKVQSAQPLPASPVSRLRVGKLCVSIQADSAAEMIERAQSALTDSKFLEFRLDTLPKPADALPVIQQFLAHHRRYDHRHLPSQALRRAIPWGAQGRAGAADQLCRGGL